MEKNAHSAWFLGPKAEYHETWEKLLIFIFRDHVHWRRDYFPEDNVVIDRRAMRENEEWIDTLNDELDKVLAAFKSHVPTHSPRYLAHMVSEQTLPSVIGYFAGMLYNANNVTGESSPVAVPMELAVGKMIAQMLGYNPTTSWTHLCSGGTLANIEAMWVARTVKFMPLVLQEYCSVNNIEFVITTPNGEKVDIKTCPVRTMLALESHQAIYMRRELIRELVNRDSQATVQSVSKIIDAHIYNSEFNVKRNGLHKILSKLGVEPVIFVSPTAHYSVKKAANILGYGEKAVRLIETDEHSRMDVDILKRNIENLPDNEYIAAVIGIAGTTESGSIDPLYAIEDARQDLAQKHNRSFWFHIDAAWGGYMRAIFNGYDIKVSDCKSIDTIALRYKDRINQTTSETIWDDDLGVYKSMLTYPKAESVTIDPHKMGYTPYPAGVVSFKYGVVTELIQQEAPYIFNPQCCEDLDTIPEIFEIGSYILEGSKPGAAAASCYLAHKTVPLNINGHGRIILQTLCSTIRLQRLMREHLGKFDFYAAAAHAKIKSVVTACDKRFTLIPLHSSDSNIVCYVVRTINANGKPEKSSLEQINALNEYVYNKMAINENHHLRRQIESDYFVSKTRYLNSVYNYNSLKPLLQELGISEKEYCEQGLFVLRTTVMNPFYKMAEPTKDYLEEFVIELHSNAEAGINALAHAQ